MTSRNNLSDVIAMSAAIKQSMNSVSRLDLEILLSHVLKVERSFLKAHPEIVLSKEQHEEFDRLVERRLNHEPVAYIVENKDFWDINLLVTKEVLIPRPETEILVEQALARLQLNCLTRVLDLGTGGGAIALAIAKHRPQAMVYAVDISRAALKVAQQNAKNLNINNIKFFAGDWFNALPLLHFKFDVIVSNPPYIATEEMEECDQAIFYEPKLALFANNNGTACLETIIVNSVSYLNANGWLLLEYGYKQAEAITKVLKNVGFYNLEFFKDLSGLNRSVIARHM